jgi:hypothetical protein
VVAVQLAPRPVRAGAQVRRMAGRRDAFLLGDGASLRSILDRRQRCVERRESSTTCGSSRCSGGSGLPAPLARRVNQQRMTREVLVDGAEGCLLGRAVCVKQRLRRRRPHSSPPRMRPLLVPGSVVAQFWSGSIYHYLTGICFGIIFAYSSIRISRFRTRCSATSERADLGRRARDAQRAAVGSSQLPAVRPRLLHQQPRLEDGAGDLPLARGLRAPPRCALQPATRSAAEERGRLALSRPPRSAAPTRP